MDTSNNKLINQFLVYIKDERKFSIHTIRAYKKDLDGFMNFLNNYDNNIGLKDIDRTAIQFFIQSLSKIGLEGKTLQRKISSIKSFYRFLTEREIIDYNISELVQIPKATKKLPHLLSKKEINRLMKLPDLSTYKGIRDKSILEILYSTGLRISELITIKIDNVDYNKKVIKVFGLFYRKFNLEFL